MVANCHVCQISWWAHSESAKLVISSFHSGAWLIKFCDNVGRSVVGGASGVTVGHPSSCFGGWEVRGINFNAGWFG